MIVHTRFKLLIAVAGVIFAGSAHAASKVEKVDIVREGIDLAAVGVRSNSGGYTTYENNSHRYLLRVFAKARGPNRVAAVALFGHGAGSSRDKLDLFEVQETRPYFFQSTNEEGWGVYKKSLAPTVKFSETRWAKTPKKLCEDNLAARIAAGMRKSDVLRREWNLQAKALFSFHVAASTKANARDGDYERPGKNDQSAAALLYPVNVVCRAST